MVSKSRFSSLVWWLVCVVVIGGFLPALLVERNSRMGGERESFQALVKHWEVGFGPDRPGPGGWLPLDAQTKGMLEGYTGTVWLQRSLPELKWRNPYLFFSHMNRFEIYLDGSLAYSFNMDNAQRRMNPMKMMHPVPVLPQDEGKTLLIRAEWDGHPIFVNDMVLAGEMDQIWYALIQVELAVLLCSFLSLTAGIVGFMTYVRSQKTLYGWFSLFCLSIGLSFLFSCRSLQWFIDMNALYYWHELLIPVAVWACIVFYASALNIGRRRLLLGVHGLMGVYLCSAAVAAIWLPEGFRSMAVEANALVSLAGYIVVTYSLARSRLKKRLQAPDGSPPVRTRERLWLLRGYWIFTLCALTNLGASMAPAWLFGLFTSHHYVYRVIEGLLPNGLLLFIVCMVMVMIGRVRGVYEEAERSAAELLVKNRELEQFHRNLERLVETRTAELQQANWTLAVTLREKAETLAEMSVLEERSRIAYEIHDVVGHTLTAAIVQLEATQKLAKQQHTLPQGKLELVSGLVRKGLEDIRKAVKLMKSDEERVLTLEESLRELIQYAEDTMDIRIEAELSLPAGLKLGRLTEQTLCHALQEGLTNGIRHGRCTYARFSIRVFGPMLQFRLINDGEPFGSSAPGFGLSSMMERVKALGGEVAIRSSSNADGTPMGCELSIDLPLPPGFSPPISR